jgi:hypothetical protein
MKFHFVSKILLTFDPETAALEFPIMQEDFI